MSDTAIFVGDSKETLSHLPDQSVHTCITSPPYFGLRDYGMGEQIGLEETPEKFVAELVSVFREVRRVLRDDGTLWLNMGDSYARTGGWSNNNGLDGVSRAEGSRAKSNMTGSGSQRLAPGLKQKDLIGIPWRVAFALQADGWYLRQDIIWHKPNPMPESATDRCTKSHEYVFLLSKSPKYYFDHESIKEPSTTAPGEKRNKRDVWSIPVRPYKGAHFATFPPDLIEPCVLAGCPVGGIVLDPFGGSGTTGMVANQHGRDAWLCELNPEYAQLALERIGSNAMVCDV